MLAYHGAEAYHSFTHGGGFYRNFFATLKGGADRIGGGLERLFITGVSPVTMDDVTSGFNIGTNISLEPDFNEMVGFTEPEVRRLVETYRDLGVFNQDVDTALGIMGEWYNGYRFAEDTETDLYNTDMVQSAISTWAKLLLTKKQCSQQQYSNLGSNRGASPDGADVYVGLFVGALDLSAYWCCVPRVTERRICMPQMDLCGTQDNLSATYGMQRRHLAASSDLSPDDAAPPRWA